MNSVLVVRYGDGSKQNLFIMLFHVISCAPFEDSNFVRTTSREDRFHRNGLIPWPWEGHAPHFHNDGHESTQLLAVKPMAEVVAGA